MKYPAGYDHDLTLLEVPDGSKHATGNGARLRFLAPDEAVDSDADYSLEVPGKAGERAHGAMQRESSVVVGEGYLRRGKKDAGNTIQRCHVLRNEGYLYPMDGLSGAAWASRGGIVIGFQNATMKSWKEEGMKWGSRADVTEDRQAGMMAEGGFGFQLAFFLPREFVESATIL